MAIVPFRIDNRANTAYSISHRSEQPLNPTPFPVVFPLFVVCSLFFPFLSLFRSIFCQLLASARLTQVFCSLLFFQCPSSSCSRTCVGEAQSVLSVCLRLHFSSTVLSRFAEFIADAAEVVFTRRFTSPFIFHSCLVC